MHNTFDLAFKEYSYAVSWSKFKCVFFCFIFVWPKPWNQRFDKTIPHCYDAFKMYRTNTFRFSFGLLQSLLQIPDTLDTETITDFYCDVTIFGDVLYPWDQGPNNGHTAVPVGRITLGQQKQSDEIQHLRRKNGLKAWSR